MVKNDQDLRSPEIIQAVCSDFLSIRPQVMGDLAYDPQVEEAVNQMKPLWLHEKKSKVTVGLERVARRLLVLCRIACRLGDSSPALEGDPREKEAAAAMQEELMAQPG
jgi:MinD-like ATPase involved in chromosome partitioning or flagellar assembly